MALRTVGVRLTAEVSDYQRKLKGAGESTRGLVGEMSKAAKAGHLDAVASQAGAVGLGLAGMAGYAVKSAADFEKSMSAVSAATHASSGEIDQLRQAALQAGKDTQYSATGAADAITELSKAGVATADVLGGGLKGALSLAAAGQLDVGEAAETAASAMTQFGLSGKEVPHIADLLAAAAGKAQGSVHDMGYALNQSGLVAAQFGLSIEDTTGALAEFASAGLLGSDAGTSFKTMLLAIANPSGTTKKLMNELGIEFYDAQGKFIGLSGVATVLRDKLGDLTEQQRQQALGQIFGSDAIRAASIIYKDGAEGVDKWKNAVNDSGYASETAAKLTDNLAGDVERLKGSLETMAIEAGGGASSGIRVLVQGVGALVDQFAGLPPAVGSTLTILSGVGGASALALAGFIKARSAVASAVEQFAAMGPAGERAGRGLQAASKWAGIAALAFVGLEIAGAVFDKLGNAAINVDKLTASLEDYATTGKMTEGLTDSFGKNLDEFGQIAQSADAATHGFWGGLNDLTSSIPGVSSAVDSMNESLYGTSFNDATDRMKALDESFTAFIGTQKDATKAGEIWNQLLTKSGLDTQQLAALLPGAYKGLQDLQKSAHAMGGASGEAASKLGDVNSALKEGGKVQDGYKDKAASVAGVVRGETDALISLSDQLKAQSDPAFAFISAQEGMTKAQKAATKAIKEHGKNSAEARSANEDLVTAALELQGAAGTVASTFDGKLDPAMRNTLKAAGLTKDQINAIAKEFRGAKKDADKYAGKYEALTGAPGAKQSKLELVDAYKAAKDYDGTYQAFMKTPGGKDAEKQVRDAWKVLNQYDGGWVAALSTTGYGKVAADLRHLLAAQRALKDNTSVNEANRELGHFFASGGPVYGPGTGTSDEIDARLSNNEHVLTADEVAALGGHGKVITLRQAALAGRRIEIGDETPGFAAGGAVTLPFRADVAATKIPKDIWSGPPSGATDDWIVRTVKARFPGMNWISKFRPGATTLTGNSSYHSKHRAVDWPASYALAKYWHDTFMGKTKELITPWNNLNIHNGQPHRYTGAVWNQHNFAGGNAHDHIAMKNGGTINEPVMGVGASGRTYSFGENYQSERVIPNWQGGGSSGGGATTTIHLSVALAAGANPREAGRQIAEQIGSYLKGGGSLWVKGKQVLP